MIHDAAQGFYINEDDEETSCPGGYWCFGGDEQPIECGLGEMCPVGTSSPIPCPAGSYGN